MHSSAPLLKFDKQGDIHIIQPDEYITQAHRQFVLIRYTLQQISLILFVSIYLILGGLFFAFIESANDKKQDDERNELISECYTNIRLLAVQLLNEQLSEDFEDAYEQWRWQETKLSNYIDLNTERAHLLDNRTAFELERLLVSLAQRQAASDKFVYKWTYSAATLYAATLVTTIGYGNIAPKTSVGKLSTVIYALIGILLVVVWLKLVGESLAFLVAQYYRCVERCLQRHLQGKEIQNRLRQKVPFWVPITLLILYLLGGSLLFASWEGWSYVDGAYFSFITFTTIGFGDLVPGESTITQRSERSILCAMYLLFGVMLTAMSFKLIQEDFGRIKTLFLRRLGIEHVHLPIVNQ